MPSSFRSALILIVCLLSSGRTPAAYKPEIYPVTLPYGNFIIEAEYDRSKAYAGNDNLPLKITITTASAKNLLLDKCESPDASKIQIDPLSNDSTTEAGALKSTYLFRVDIKGSSDGKEGASPKIYTIQLYLRHPDNPGIIKRTLDLNVGVRSKGMVKAIIAEDAAPQEFLTGQSGAYTLELFNYFPDYPVTIRQIEVKSNPPELIEKMAPIPMNVRIEPQSPKSFEVPFKVAGMSYKNLLSGFGDSNYLIMTITYDDSNDRVISDPTQKVKIKVRPSGRVLFISMLIGVVVGTVLKFVLQHLQRKGIISRKEALWFASSTIFIGLVVSIIALVGKVKIVFFETTGSYDVPSVIFVIGLIAAVLGAQLLTTWFKTSDQKGATNPPRKRGK